MSQGYVFKMYFDIPDDDPLDPPASTDEPVQFQNVSLSFGGNELDTSSSINDDAVETDPAYFYNQGFSDVDGDLKTMSGEIDTIIKDSRVIAIMTNFIENTRYPYLRWAAEYQSYSPLALTKTITGLGLFVSTFNLTFNIPGAARMRMSFRSLQTGYSGSTVPS